MSLVVWVLSGPGGYSDVAVLSGVAADKACVVFEYDTCSIQVSCIDPSTLLTTKMKAASQVA
jgi:hypothetical protein